MAWYAQGLSNYKNQEKKPFTISYKNGKRGCTDSSGKIIVPYLYDIVTPFVNDSFFMVRNYSYALSGLYNYKGELIYDLSYPKLFFLEDKRIILRTYFKNGTARHDAVNYKGEIVIRPSSLSFLTTHSSQYLIIRKKQKVYILKNYSLLPIQGNFDSLPQNYGLFISSGVEVGMAKKYRMLENGTDGKITVSLFENDDQKWWLDTSQAAVVKVGNNYGMMNKNGEIINNTFYGRIEYYLGDKAKVELNGKYGLMNGNGSSFTKIFYNEIKFVATYTSLLRLMNMNIRMSPGIPVVKTETGWKFISDSGQEIKPIGYDSISPFYQNGLAMVIKNEKYGLVDKTGNEVLPVRYDSIEFLWCYEYITIKNVLSDNRFLVKIGNQKKYVNRKGLEIIMSYPGCVDD